MALSIYMKTLFNLLSWILVNIRNNLFLIFMTHMGVILIVSIFEGANAVFGNVVRFILLN